MNKEDNKFLIEIGVEELPSSYVTGALNQFSDNMKKFLEEEKILYSQIRKYATPRRLTLIVEGLADKQADVESEVKGPNVKIAYKEDGSINKPLEGFMKSQGVREDDLEVRKIKEVDYIFAHVHRQGRPSRDLLANGLGEIIRNISFPKTMRWGGKQLRFARPIRWLLSLYNSEVVPFDLEGIPVGNTTRGHRFLGSSRIEISDIDQYETALENNYVILDQEKRRDMILLQINNLAKSLGGEIKPDPELLEELTYIVEYPTAIVGNIKEDYLDLPPVVITTPMREHLRFSPIYKSEDELMPYFITIRNGNKEHAEIVARGNEKVLDARLDDAKFFYENDREKKLEEYVEELDGIVFQEQLGTMADKIRRMDTVAQRIGEKLAVGETTLESIRRAILLSKADLETSMVKEFTELEGIMGHIYALEDGENPVVAQAIEEQYMPVASGSDLPKSTAGTIVSLTEKLDTLCGMFAIGMTPTGSQDPFALRRKVIGILRMLNEKKWAISLKDLIDTSLLTYINACGLTFDHQEVKFKIVDFILGRIENMLSEEGIRYDIINALSHTQEDDSLSLFQKARALNSFFMDEDHKMFVEAASRVANLAEKEEKIDGSVSFDLLAEKEKALYEALIGRKEAYREKIGLRNFSEALDLAEELTPYVHQYFEDVMIMVEDQDLRANRLKLIQEIDQIYKRIFDARQIVTNA